MAQFHFVEDYENLVKNLIKDHPMDEAMSLAVGGDWEKTGDLCSDVLLYAGLKNGMSVLDFGCGSGRIAHFISQKRKIPNFLGTDIVQELLDYAATKTPDHFRFVKHQELSIPADDRTFDFAYAFSVFTHLLQTETFIYMQDIYRTLKPGGKLVFSFLEFSEPNHWHIFQDSVDRQKKSTLPHLNALLARDQITIMAKNIGFSVTEFTSGSELRWKKGTVPLGQSLAILKRDG
jgi:ubiquinone/menaquinone biosynthesis C-methylase UbiE